MKVIITQVIDANTLTDVEDAKAIALNYRRAGFRTEIITDDEFKKRKLDNSNQQDLSQIKGWPDVARLERV